MSGNENPLEIVTKIKQWTKLSTDPTEKPAQFVREVHRQWKDDGGKLAGKPRHSDRFLETQLKSTGRQVKSLTPKLAGKTNINPTDGASLVSFFFSHWPTRNESSDDISYQAILTEDEIKVFSQYVQEKLDEKAGERSVLAGSLSGRDVDDTLPGSPVADVILNNFEDSDAIITVAPEQVLVTRGPKTELIGFRDLMDEFRRIEIRDRRKRALVWVLDLGGPLMDDESTRKKYLNVQQLIVRLKALEHYKDTKSEERLEWLKSRGAVIILDTYGDWRGSVSVKKLPNFSTHHATLSTLTPDWLQSPFFRALYGSDLERLQQRVFTLFFNTSRQWRAAEHIGQELRYFGLATFLAKGEYFGRGLELPPLPMRYAEAFRTVCSAAAHVLNLKVHNFKELEIDGELSVQQLAYLGFRVLRIDEFIQLY